MSCELVAAEGGACMALDRRSFLMCALASGAALGAGEFAAPAGATPSAAGGQAQNDAQFTFEAKFYEKQENRKIKCKLCPRECVVGDKERGYCGVRENHGGVYYTLVHSRVCAAHIDPIEKKPLFHYLPGTTAFSIATAGCNVNCKFCRIQRARSRNSASPSLSVGMTRKTISTHMPSLRMVTMASSTGLSSPLTTSR